MRITVLRAGYDPSRPRGERWTLMSPRARDKTVDAGIEAERREVARVRTDAANLTRRIAALDLLTRRLPPLRRENRAG